MRSTALSDLLPDFGPRASRSEASPTPIHAAAAASEQVDTTRLIAEAVARAEEALETRLNAAHQSELEAERQANAEEARAFLETLGADVGTTVADRVGDMEERVTRLVSDSVARMIGGILSDDLQKRSLAALAQAVRAATADAEASRIEIRGPLALFEPLKTALGARADNLHFTEAPGFDLSLLVDDTVFETRMAEWSAALAEVLQ
ncbi:hypothetical protein ASD44_10245 [Mesorhizobium sp. Root554]|uniref:hypothetical protein n=1 Tax=unclassified Mesorhizobium TaxID=325217 RepID=UPI0006FF50EB|nr:MULTISPECIES: hypothetical protein [unclassified Mesorhizobium]KQZ15933.1 hypothetical protein ASD27_10255 [Mesorhizobium sp. Root1471]KQZ38444.1 hypothetical protein ASD44_10245 [Mesorhizobium sp. Root554]